MRNNLVVKLFALALVASGLSCEQYEYTSPLPGILEIRLRAKNSRTDFMPFGAGSSFFINLKSLEAIRDDNSRLTVLPDLNAIRRDDDGDVFNTLDTLARDSVLLLGRTYAPPATYHGIDLTTTPETLPGFGMSVVVFDEFGIPRIFPVVQPLPVPSALKQLPRPGESLRFTVNEGRRTVVNVLIDLDSTLIRRVESFDCDLQFYVSSIQNY